nr:MAG TPA: hypothetical protein [Caudoviricetes sp.]
MKKVKWVKKIERISDAGDIKESIYKPEKGKDGISIVTVKRAIRLQSGSRWETKEIKINKEGTVLKTKYDTFEKACAAADGRKAICITLGNKNYIIYRRKEAVRIRHEGSSEYYH